MLKNSSPTMLTGYNVIASGFRETDDKFNSRNHHHDQDS